MRLVNAGVRGGSTRGGPILYCCPDDLEWGSMETFLPWLLEVSLSLSLCRYKHRATATSHLRTEKSPKAKGWK